MSLSKMYTYIQDKRTSTLHTTTPPDSKTLSKKRNEQTACSKNAITSRNSHLPTQQGQYNRQPNRQPKIPTRTPRRQRNINPNLLRPMRQWLQPNTRTSRRSRTSIDCPRTQRIPQASYAVISIFSAYSVGLSASLPVSTASTATLF